MRRLTKTFVENRFYRRASANQFDEVPKTETGEGPALDEQVAQWVRETGSVIIHPGQLGMHTSWHGTQDDPYQVKCLTFGQTVLYQEPSDEQRPFPDSGEEPVRADEPTGGSPAGDVSGRGPTPAGPEVTFPGGKYGSSPDGAGPA